MLRRLWTYPEIAGRCVGSTGRRRRCKPACSGVLSFLCPLHALQAMTMFDQQVVPPLDLGTTWSYVAFARDSWTPQYWHLKSSLTATLTRENLTPGALRPFVFTLRSKRTTAGLRRVRLGERMSSSYSESISILSSNSMCIARCHGTTRWTR